MFRRREKRPLDKLDEALTALLRGKSANQIMQLLEEARKSPQQTTSCPCCGSECLVVIGLLSGHHGELLGPSGYGLCPASWEPVPTPNIVFTV